MRLVLLKVSNHLSFKESSFEMPFPLLRVLNLVIFSTAFYIYQWSLQSSFDNTKGNIHSLNYFFIFCFQLLLPMFQQILLPMFQQILLPMFQQIEKIRKNSLSLILNKLQISWILNKFQISQKLAFENGRKFSEIFQ